MKKKRYIALTIMLSLLCMSKTYAACTQEEIKEFKSVESEYKIESQLDTNTKKYTLKLTRTYPEKYDYKIYVKGRVTCNDISENTTECSVFNPGTYKLEIVGQTETCDDVLKKLTIDLEPYNKYSESPLCDGIEEFVLCQTTYKKELTEEEFESRVNTYKQTKKEKLEEELEKTPTKKGIIDKINTYVEENLIQVIIVIVFIILVTITSIITYKSMKKSRRLE